MYIIKLTSKFDDDIAKGAVGFTTPNRTGVIRESAVSHNSSMANLCNV